MTQIRVSASVGYLGPRGTYSEEAALEHGVRGRRLVPFGSIPAVLRALADGEVDQAVVPIENSLEGAVTHTTDLLIHGAPLSTASAVRDMKASVRPAAAVSSRRAAEIFGAAIVDRDIEDVRNNKTRFVVLAPGGGAWTGRDKTSLCFDFTEDAAGTLCGALGEFAARRINMIKIESRPDKRSLGRYIFLVDIEGHREDPPVREALEGIRARASMFRILGSYPRVRAHS